MNSTQLLLLGLLVWFAMSNKSKETRNVILVVVGILCFCILDGTEGITDAEIGPVIGGSLGAGGSADSGGGGGVDDDGRGLRRRAGPGMMNANAREILS